MSKRLPSLIARPLSIIKQLLFQCAFSLGGQLFRDRHVSASMFVLLLCLKIVFAQSVLLLVFSRVYSFFNPSIISTLYLFVGQ
jgi:hypothetical protein